MRACHRAFQALEESLFLLRLQRGGSRREPRTRGEGVWPSKLHTEAELNCW